MAIYTVHAPVGYGVDVRATDDKVVFVRDGFYVWALVAALVWLVWHRLWLALIGYIAISIAAELLFKAMDVGVVTRFVVMIVFAVLMGFEAGTLWRWTLSRGKWRQVDIVSAADEEEAERKFFSRWASAPRGNDIVSKPPTQPLPPTLTVGTENDVLGSFPEPWSAALSVAIIDYGSGNLHSAAKAFERAARAMDDPEKVIVTRDPDVVFKADRIVLPGVGAFADCRKGLDSLDGMVDAMTEAVRDKARPFFGICVGMQLMATQGKEYVTTKGLNWIVGDVEKITPRDENLKIPHMGWNTLDLIREHPVLEKLPLGDKGRHAYFVHSYHLNAANDADVVARADYGGPVTAIVAKDTAIGTQFHSEKSQRFGLALISNFLKWKP